MKYEAHLTFDKAWAAQVRTLATGDWKFSQIDGDPVLEQKAFCYLTKHANNVKQLLRAMRERAATAGVRPLRQKIERILFDTATGTDEITP